MARKQSIANETAAAAAPARAAKPKSTTPRVRTVKHSKTVPVETPVVRMDSGHMDAMHVDSPQIGVDPHDAIAQIAYGYWESRGCQHGMHLEDWLRAERDYLQQAEAALA